MYGRARLCRWERQRKCGANGEHARIYIGFDIIYFIHYRIFTCNLNYGMIPNLDRGLIGNPIPNTTFRVFRYTTTYSIYRRAPPGRSRPNSDSGGPPRGRVFGDSRRGTRHATRTTHEVESMLQTSLARCHFRHLVPSCPCEQLFEAFLNRDRSLPSRGRNLPLRMLSCSAAH
jgi:hypothetical protein